MKGKLEMGRKLLKIFGSKPGFLSIGVTAADLKNEGTIPVVRDACIMVEIRGSREGRQDLIKLVGRGSNRQVEGLDLRIVSAISKRLGS